MKITRRPAWLILATIVFGSGCIVPLKTPAVSNSGEKPSIDFGRLTEFAVAAGHAYDTNDLIEAAYGKSNVIIRDLPAADLRYFILVSSVDHTQMISIRGTANKANAWADVDSIKILDSRLGIFLHLGFKQGTDLVYADATPFLHKDYRTRITGHSLGGALACILMMNMIHDGYVVDQVFTFGQPRVTNEKGGTDFKKAPVLRVINDQDLVAQVPPSNLIYDLSGPYEHFGPEITLLANKQWTYSPVNIPKDFLTGEKWKQLDLENGTDHQIKNYIDRLQALKGTP